MLMRVFILFLFLSCFACKKSDKEQHEKNQKKVENVMKFDKAKWKIKDDLDYLYRNDMLNDIVYNDTIRTLTKNEILDLFGKPDRINEGYLYYTITQEKLGFFPLHTKTLVFKLADNSKIEWIKIHK